ncbi:amino acid adenylation domain-containing protein [Pseudomonas lactis]|nr:amino acid adenylation domain-containing protein [Pseudomonas lactis]PRW71355.1 non-ribosomal peptide synthetase [Pseudomonas fluorescens]PRW71744.1 non-ribosomal peptide synthetase [Pseudomonas fluorescens]
MDTQVAQRIVKRFIGLPLEQRRIYLQKMLAEDVSPANLPIPVVRDETPQLLLSYAQERQWFIWQLEPDSAAYHLPTALRLKGLLDVTALQRSFDTLVARHESLRTCVHQNGERRIQVVSEQAIVQIQRQDIDETQLGARIEELIAQPFDLQFGPLLRVTLLHLDDAEHVLLVVQHHIVSDGGSMQVMVEELVKLYTAFSQGHEVQLPALPIQYADYALWQRAWMEAGEQDRQMDYWRARLGGEQPVLELPFDRPRPPTQSHRGASLDIALPQSLVAALRDLVQREGVTLSMLLLASFQLLMHRYSGQVDVRIGVPTANRNRVETERLIGFFVNTQVIRADIDGQMSVSALLQQVRTRVLEAQAHQDLPFEQLVVALQPERNLSYNPLFQVMFNHQADTRKASNAQPVGPLQVQSLEWSSRTAQFDLSLDTRESDDGIWAALTYATDLFDTSTLERMARHWQNLLQGMSRDAHQPVDRLVLLDSDEHDNIVHGWNATTRDYPLQACVHQIIEAQVVRTPDAQAVGFAGESLSYAELNRRANRLAHRLRAAGVGPDVLVGVAVERSVEMVVGLLAVLKAGGAYLPLDPEYPRERLAYMLQDSDVKLLLTQRHWLELLPIPHGLDVLVLGEDTFYDYSEANPSIALDGENLAYVIYTSGSTGKPKGAGNRHAALTNRLCWMQEAYGLDAGDTVLQKTPFSFDVSVWEFFWPLMSGARLMVAAPGDHRDPARLIDLINQHQITTLHFVPSMLQAFVQNPGVGSCHSLLRIVCSGEALPVDAQQQVFAKLPRATLYNLYGPTEAAIDVTHWTCVAQRCDTVPIGRPIANVATYVLDAHLLPVPVGVPGELYLGGIGLARSYHQRPALTAERFVPCPFHVGTRLYRTGDRVRQRADGVIEYLGRLDHQVKLRGLRIELGEIEARLLEHERVREASVQVRDGKQLVGYLVLHGSAEDWRDQLSAHLAQHLPGYMVPAQWVVLQQMPLSPNGKLDRKALPEPDTTQQTCAYLAPQTELEKQLAAIWSDILGVKRVGLRDNFFELGGHSLLVLMLKERIRIVTGINLPVTQLILNPTVQGQVNGIQGNVRTDLIVPLNSNTSGTPLYLFHPSYGSVHCYKAIALAMREQRPVMGVICRALAQESGVVPSWDRMVEDYTEQLLIARPEGAYRLAGWSLGGNLAMEVAYRLERAGRIVECVGWIDAPPPVRVAKFWNDAGMADERAVSISEQRAELLGVIFPHHAEQIHGVWLDSQGDDEQRWGKVNAWAEQTLGAAYETVKDQLLEDHEIQISWEIKRLLDLRLQEADYQPIAAPVLCWWAALSKAGQHQELIESSMCAVIGALGIQQSTVVHTTHDRIIDNPEFVSSFAELMG